MTDFSSTDLNISNFKKKFLENIKEHLGKGLNDFAHDIGAKATRGIQGKWCGFAMQEVLKKTFEDFGIDPKLFTPILEANGTDNLSAAKVAANGKKNGTYERKSDYHPKEGDIAIILREKTKHGRQYYSGHVTAVDNVEGGVVHCIGGNVTHKVGHEKHPLGSKSLKGFINVGELFGKVVEHYNLIEHTKQSFSGLSTSVIERAELKPAPTPLTPEIISGVKNIQIKFN